MSTETKFVLHIDFLLEAGGTAFKVFDRKQDAEQTMCKLIRNSETFAEDWTSIRLDEEWTFSSSKKGESKDCRPSQVTLEFLKLHPYLTSTSLQTSCQGQEQTLLDMFRRVKATTKDAEISDEDVMLFSRLEPDSCGLKLVEAPYYPPFDESPSRKKRK